MSRFWHVDVFEFIACGEEGNFFKVDEFIAKSDELEQKVKEYETLSPGSLYISTPEDESNS